MMRTEKEGIMKRVGLVAGIVVLLFAVGSFALRGSAQDDAVPVLQTQVADLQTRVAALESASGTPAPGVTVVASNGTTMLFQGTGHQIVDVGYLEGTYTLHAIYNGTGAQFDTINVTLVGKSGKNRETPFFVIDAPVDEKTVLLIYDWQADDYLMEIEAQGDWTITIEPAS